MSSIMAATGSADLSFDRQECRAMNLSLNLRKKLHAVLDNAYALGWLVGIPAAVVTIGLQLSQGSKSPAEPKERQKEYAELQERLKRLPALRRFAELKSTQQPSSRPCRPRFCRPAPMPQKPGRRRRTSQPPSARSRCSLPSMSPMRGKFLRMKC
jgi:hypothetical protein